MAQELRRLPLRTNTKVMKLEKLTGDVGCSKKDHFIGSGNKAEDHPYGF